MNKSDAPQDAAPPPKRRGKRASTKAAPLIIAVVVSAASTRSLENLLTHFVPSQDQALVLVFQRREALDERRLRNLIAARDKAAIADVQDGSAPEGGRIYLAP